VATPTWDETPTPSHCRDVRLPKDVLIPFRWKNGRPNETEEIYEAWIAKGRPATSWRVCDDLSGDPMVAS
jgi:hypothetical protein